MGVVTVFESLHQLARNASTLDLRLTSRGNDRLPGFAVVLLAPIASVVLIVLVSILALPPAGMANRVPTPTAWHASNHRLLAAKTEPYYEKEGFERKRMDIIN